MSEPEEDLQEEQRDSTKKKKKKEKRSGKKKKQKEEREQEEAQQQVDEEEEERRWVSLLRFPQVQVQQRTTEISEWLMQQTDSLKERAGLSEWNSSHPSLQIKYQTISK